MKDKPADQGGEDTVRKKTECDNACIHNVCAFTYANLNSLCELKQARYELYRTTVARSHPHPSRNPSNLPTHAVGVL